MRFWSIILIIFFILVCFCSVQRLLRELLAINIENPERNLDASLLYLPASRVLSKP